MIKSFLKSKLLLLVVGLVFTTSFVDVAFSQPKKKTKSSGKSKARKAGSSRNKKRAQSVGSSKKRSVKRKSSSKLVTKNKVKLSDVAQTQKVEEKNCRQAFVSCMDAQINDVIDKYTYLYDDDAVQAYLDTGEPFRCLFYDKTNEELESNMQVISSCRDMLNESIPASFNIAQADIDKMVANLYSQYVNKPTCVAGKATLTPITTAKTGICGTCSTYKTLNSFLESNDVFNTAWKNYQGLCKDKYQIEINKVKPEAEQTLDYKDIVNRYCSARDVNDLYFSYNYYCDLRNTTLKSAVGVKTNYCMLSSEEANTEGLTGEAKTRAEIANVFGTTSSSEYYKEALRRVEAGELKMVNFTDSELYKSRIEGLGLEALKSFDISTLLNTSTKCEAGYRYNVSVGACHLYDSENAKYYDAGGVFTPQFVSTNKDGVCDATLTYDEVNKKCIKCESGTWNSIIRKCVNSSVDSNGKNIFVVATQEEEKDARSIYTDLGIARDSSLFSINVVPPLGSGLVFPSALFNQAVRYCFDGKTKSLAGVAKNLREEYKAFNKTKSTLAACKEIYKNDLERYYLSSYWPKEDVEPGEDGTYNATTDYEELDFMSAKKSCDVYEQNLISVRDNHYANFDTQIKNYLEDALAGIIKNKIKDITTIANVATVLKKDDAQRTLDNMQAKVDADLQNLETEIEMEKNRTELFNAQMEQQTQYIANVNKLKESILKLQGSAMFDACGKIADKYATKWKNDTSQTGKNLIDDISSIVLKVSSSGGIYFKDKDNIFGGNNPFYTKDFDSLSSAEFPSFACVDLPDFYSSTAFVNINSIVNSANRSVTGINPIKPKENSELAPGVYKVEVVGGGGGAGGGADACVAKEKTGRDGGSGEIRTITFAIFENTPYEVSLGSGGDGGEKNGRETNWGETGGAGGNTTFKVPTLNVNILAKGGKGGEAMRYYYNSDKGHWGCYHSGGENYTGATAPFIDCWTGDGKGDGCRGIGTTGDGRDGGDGAVRIYPL